MGRVNVDDAVLLEFQEVVLRKHGKTHGVLKSEATEALRAHTQRLRSHP